MYHSLSYFHQVIHLRHLPLLVLALH